MHDKIECKGCFHSFKYQSLNRFRAHLSGKPWGTTHIAACPSDCVPVGIRSRLLFQITRGVVEEAEKKRKAYALSSTVTCGHGGGIVVA